jgi:hypothetical protein
LVLHIPVFLKAASGAVEVLRTAKEKFDANRQRRTEVREAKRMLGLADPAAEAYRSDAIHPLFTPGELHPDNEAALLSVGADLLDQAAVERDSLAVDATESSLLLFGSPISDGLSRLVFGYSQLPDGEGLSLDQPQFELRYVWDLNPEQVGEGAVRRFVYGKGWVERPPWQIRDLRENISPRLVPETDADGLLREDYLLVTRIPNFLSSEAELKGQFLVSFGGAHGTGTRAVSLLFTNRKLMARVAQELRQRTATSTHRIGGIPRAYQLLFRVSNIKHGPNGSIPGGLELVDAVILPDDAGAWKSARRHVAPRLNEGARSAVTPGWDPSKR